MNAPILVNGTAQDHVSARDRGLHYGDGVFRTLRVAAGQPLVWDEQHAHLAGDCRRLGLTVPDAELLYREVRRLYADDGDGVLKIVITRGGGGRGYAPPEPAQPTRLLLRSPLPEGLADKAREGIAVMLCATRLGCNPALAGVKHLNRLEQVLARRECQQAGYPEGLVRDADGALISGVMSNLFLVTGQCLMTPKLDRAGVCGLTRQRILRAAEATGRDVAETRIEPEDLDQASEVFLCNSLFGVWPVTRLGDRSWVPGPLSAWAAGALEAA